jgi:ATP-dependent helicase/nuclease subunit B
VRRARRPRRPPPPGPEISVTEVEDLIRDPYKVYARRVLGLRPLDPLRPQPDAALRGSALHDILDRFVRGLPRCAAARTPRPSFCARDAVLAGAAPWPAARRLWHARLRAWRPGSCGPRPSAAPSPTPWLREVKGRLDRCRPALNRPVTLVGKADRIDRLPDGRIAIYDYKSGKPPTEKEERAFAKQLWLEAAMAADGAFGEDGPLETARIAYIGLGAQPEVRPMTRRGPSAELTGRVPRLLGPFPRSAAPAFRRAARARHAAGPAITTSSRATANGTRPSTPVLLPSGRRTP